jgi:hypothetical protein
MQGIHMLLHTYKYDARPKHALPPPVLDLKIIPEGEEWDNFGWYDKGT